MATGLTTTLLNYSGLLFNTNRKNMPLLSLLRRYNVNARTFPVTSKYASSSPSQPEITEYGSLTAPTPTVVARSQQYNVTQIFQKATGVSYSVLSNGGLMSGINIAGQENPISDELSFQIGVKMYEMSGDLEYTLINGVYQAPTDENTAGKTRGFINAITTNVVATSGTPELKPDHLDEAMSKIKLAGGDTSMLYLFVNPIQLRQVSKYYSKESGYVLPASRTVGGLSFNEFITPFGNLAVVSHDLVPAGTALILNLPVSAIVEQPVIGKGNFFYESLAKTGAGETGQLYGQAGLDYGPEWYHAKITGLSTAYVDKTYVESVNVINSSLPVSIDDSTPVDINVANATPVNVNIANTAPIEVEAEITNTTENPVHTQEIV